MCVSSIPAPQPELLWWVETAFTACGCHMWFWNFPTPPMIGCPAPCTMPQAQIGHMGRLSSYPRHPWGGGVGGLSLGHLCGAEHKPLAQKHWGELGAGLRAEAPQQRGPHPHLHRQLCVPYPWSTPAEEDREPRPAQS